MPRLETLTKSKFVLALTVAGVMLAACSQKPENANEAATQQLIEATQKADEAAIRAETAQKALEVAQAAQKAAEDKAAGDAVQVDAAAKLKAAEAKATAAEKDAAAARRRAANAERHSAANQSVAQSRPAPVQPVVCQDCGTISDINAIKVKGEGSGMGAVAGAIAGAVIGHQFGRGSGNTAAKIGGAAVGGYAGNEAEKRFRGDTVYDVTVRMDAGGSRTVRVTDASMLSNGEHVRVNGSNIERL